MEDLIIEVNLQKEKIQYYKDQIKLCEKNIVSIKHKYCQHEEIITCRSGNPPTVSYDYTHMCNLCGVHLTDSEVNNLTLSKILYRVFQ